MIVTIGKFGMRASLNPLGFEFRSNLQEPDRWLVEYAGGHPTASGQTMTERTAMQLSAVWCAVNLIANSIATSPLCIYEKLPGDKGRVELDDHPLYPLLHDQPNEEMTAFTFWKTLVSHKLLWGNMYGEIETKGSGEPAAIWPLRPDRTFPRRLEGRDGKPTGELVYAARSSSGPEVMLRPDQVLHAMGYSYDGLRGLSPIALHRESLGLSMAAADYGARFFGNDARPGGVLKTANTLKTEARKRLKESWEEAHRGGDQAHRVAVLEQGLEWQSTTMSNEDAQFLEIRKFQLSEIARMYHVPLHKLADLDKATFSNIEDQEIEYVKGAVMPVAEAIEQEIFRKLIKPTMPAGKTYYAEFNLEGAMRGDPESRAKYYDGMWKDGFMTHNEVRKKENLNPVPDGDKLWVPVTQTPIDLALNPPEPAPAGAPGGQGKPGGPGSQKQPPEPDKAKAKARQLADRRRGLIQAFIPLLANVGERLVRKETAALSRSGADADNFFREHREYVCEAVKPMFDSIEESVWLLCRMEGHEGAARADREKFVEAYAEGFAHRYAKAALIQHITKPLSWGNGVSDRAREEATRAANAFALQIYKASGVKTLAWMLAETCRHADCLAMAPHEFKPGAAHPPSDARCECQLIAVDHA